MPEPPPRVPDGMRHGEAPVKHKHVRTRATSITSLEVFVRQEVTQSSLKRRRPNLMAKGRDASASSSKGSTAFYWTCMNITPPISQQNTCAARQAGSLGPNTAPPSSVGNKSLPRPFRRFSGETGGCVPKIGTQGHLAAFHGHV